MLCRSPIPLRPPAAARQRPRYALRLGLLCVVFALCSGAACAARAPAPVCSLDLNLQLFPPWQAQPEHIDLSVWSGLLLRGVDMDCTGAPLCSASEVLQGPPRHALEPAQLQLVEEGDGLWLVWLKTHLSSDGQATGPVALVRVAYEDLKVMAIGALRAPADDTVLSLVTLAGSQVLRVDSGHCSTDTQADDTCWAKTQLLWAQSQVFVKAPGGDLDRVRRDRTPRPQGGSRLYALTSESTPDPANQTGFIITEHLVVTDLEPGQSVASGRIWRRSEGTRTLRWDKTRWQSSATALWDRVRTR